MFATVIHSQAYHTNQAVLSWKVPQVQDTDTPSRIFKTLQQCPVKDQHLLNDQEKTPLRRSLDDQEASAWYYGGKYYLASTQTRTSWLFYIIEVRVLGYSPHRDDEQFYCLVPCRWNIIRGSGSSEIVITECKQSSNYSWVVVLLQGGLRFGLASTAYLQVVPTTIHAESLREPNNGVLGNNLP